MAQNCFGWDFYAFLIPTVLLILFTSVIVWVSLKTLCLRPNNISIFIKSTYYISCISGILSIAITIASICLCQPSVYLYTIGIIIYMIFTKSILAALLLQIYLTFELSIFKMSRIQKIIVSICYLITVILCCLQAPLWIMANRHYDAEKAMLDFTSQDPIAVLLGDIMMIEGLMATLFTIYGIIAFMKKMYGISKLQQDVQASKLLNNATKYLSLLSIAIMSTVITFTLVFALAYIWNSMHLYDYVNGLLLPRLMFSVTSIDCYINIVCLYLQFPFANKDYNKYCGCLGRCCRYLVTQQVKRQAKEDTDEHQGTVTNSTDESINL